MKKWEYHFEHVMRYNREEAKNIMENRGNNGWELVNVINVDENYIRFYWKREII